MATDRLREALDRGKRFTAEIKACDAKMRAQLTDAWKESIMEEFVEILRATNDPELLASLDRNITVVKCIHTGSRDY